MTGPRYFAEWTEPRGVSVPMTDDDLDEACRLIQELAHSTGERARCARTIKALVMEVVRLKREIQEWEDGGAVPEKGGWLWQCLKFKEDQRD